eukprot:s569_g12.t1
MCGTIRSTYRDGFKLRYRLARRVAPWSCFFLVCSSGSEAFIRACEFVECKVHQPRSNGGYPAPKNRRTKHRTRPAKHLRHAAVPHVSAVSERCVDKRYCCELRRICSRDLTEGAETSHVDFWTLSYAQAYLLQQKEWYRKTGAQGPLDVYAHFYRRLLVLYLGLRQCTVNLEAAWRRDPFMAIKCAFMLRCLKKPGQSKHARKHVDDWLAFGNYAGTGIHYLKLPHACLIPFGRRTADSSAARGCAGIVADAGQFFETVAPARAIKEARLLMDLELEELRRYKEKAEAAAAATREAEKKKAEQEAREAEFKRMEERILRAFQSPSKHPAKKKSGSPSAAGGLQAHEQPLSTLAARFIESLTDNHVSSEGLCSWEGRNLGEPFGKRAPEQATAGVQARGISVPKMCSLTRPCAAKHLPEKGCCQAASACPAPCRSMVRFWNSI